MCILYIHCFSAGIFVTYFEKKNKGSWEGIIYNEHVKEMNWKGDDSGNIK